MDKLSKLKEVLGLLQNDTVKPSDLKEFLASIVTLIKASKQKFEAISDENRTAMQDTLKFAAKQYKEALKLVDDKDVKNLKTARELQQKINEVTSLIRDVKAMVPKKGEPGKDADEDLIIDKVLKLIKIPEIKEFELTGEQIVDHINDLPTDIEYQIDAKHIKNLPKTIYMGGTGGSGSGGSSDYIPQGVTSATVGGIASGTNLGTTATPVQDILDDMFYPYAAPSTTLSATPSAGLYEKGNTQASVALSSTTTKRTNPITSFVFKKDGTTIYTSGAPNPTGGTETYTDATGVSTTTTYSAVVGDGTSTGTATATFTFVSAYYYGVGAVGLNVSSNGGGLTKVVQGNTASYAVTTSPSTQVFYFLYPDSYPALTSIKDPNNFEYIQDFTVTTGVSITNSYGNVNTYRKYEFNNLTTQTAFTLTYTQ